MDNEQPTPTRKVIPPISLVAIICLAVGLGIGYVFGKQSNNNNGRWVWSPIASGYGQKMDTRTGEAFAITKTFVSGTSGDATEYSYTWERVND